jgi:hypothetical protein
VIRSVKGDPAFSCPVLSPWLTCSELLASFLFPEQPASPKQTKIKAVIKISPNNFLIFTHLLSVS